MDLDFYALAKFILRSCRPASTVDRARVTRLRLLSNSPSRRPHYRRAQRTSKLVRGSRGSRRPPLFDYAFGRLNLAEAAAELADQLQAAPDLLLIARPSLAMRLEDLWARDDGGVQFWDLALRLAVDSQVVITRLVAPAVVAENLDAFDQLSPVLAELDVPHEERRTAARRLLYEIVAARMAAGPESRPLVASTPPALETWAQLAADLSDRAGNDGAAAWLLWALWREAVA